MSAARRCFLRCLDSSHPDILLPDGQNVIVGRGPDTKIKDKRCSRQQLAARADYAQFIVQVKLTGDNSSVVAGTALTDKGDGASARHGDVIEVLKGQYKHKVIFDPPSAATTDAKRSLSPTKGSNKRRKTEDRCPDRDDDDPQGRLWKNLRLAVVDKETRGGRFIWQEAGGGQVHVMTTQDCQAKKKASD